MIRVFTGIIMLFLGTLVGPWLILPFAVLHAFSWFAIELVFIGAAFDAYFGVVHSVPYYTLAAIALLLVAEWVKPQLSMYMSE